MGNMVMIPENLMALPSAVAVAGSQASVSMADDNLLTENPSKFWRSSGTRPADVKLDLSVNDKIPVQASAVALVKHNLYRGDQYRVRFMGGVSLTSYGDMVPTGTISATNVTSSSLSAPNYHLDVDEGFTPDGEWLTPTTPAFGSYTWSVRFSFNTPPSDPVAMADGMVFALYVKAGSAVTYGSRAPTVQCKLWENGGVAALADLGTKTISSTTGQWLYFPCNASLLGTSDGSLVELEILFAGRGAGMVTGHPPGHLGAVVWRVDPNGPATNEHDSGWLTYAPFSGSGLGSQSPVVDGESNSILYRAGSAITTTYVLIDFRSDHAPDDYAWLSEALPIPPGYVQIGTIVIGETWSPANNFTYGPLVGVVDSSPRKRTYGGQLFGSRRPTRRVIGINLTHLTPTEAHTILDRILWRNGAMKPILISLLPDDAIQSKHTTIFAVPRNTENWIKIQPDQGYECNIQMEWEEVL